MSELRFTVPGKPVPQGSMRAFLPRNCSRPVVISDNQKLKPYRIEVGACAVEAISKISGKMPLYPEKSPVQMRVTFYFVRPKSAKNRQYPTVKPDVDKLLRAVCDALNGIVWHDDAQLIWSHAEKLYGDRERTEIVVRANG